MIKKVAFILMLVCSEGYAAAPVIDPADYFTGWPWVDSLPATWQKVDSTNHCIKQIWYSLEDRAKAAGYGGIPLYERSFPLSFGIKTNWSYTNWAIWTPTTNNYMTNYYPRLQLIGASNLVNQITNFMYNYPVNPGTDYSGVKKGTGHVAVTRDMLAAITGTIFAIHNSFVPEAASTNFASWSNGVPVFCMAGLLTSAGCGDLCSNFVYDAWGNCTNGDWAWRDPLPSNGVIHVRALDDVAAVIAQTKRIVVRSVASSPSLLINATSVGPNYGFSALQYRTTTNSTSGAVFDAPQRFPFAWMQSSTDQTWASSLAWDRAWTNGYYTNESSTISYEFTNNPHADWPLSGWYGQANVTGFFNVVRGDAANGNGGWLWRLGAWSGESAGGLTLTVTGGDQIQGPDYSGMWNIDSQWENSTGTWTHYEGPSRDSLVYFTKVYDTSAWETHNFTTTNITEQQQPPGIPYNFTCSGNYMVHTDNTLTVSFTNNESVTNTWLAKIETATSFTNFPTYSTTAISTSEVTGTEPFDYWEYEPDLGGSQSNYGDATMFSSLDNNGFWSFAYLCSMRTDNQRTIWTNAGTGYFYVAGGTFGSRDGHRVNTSNTHPEWTNATMGATKHTWSYTNSSEIYLTENKTFVPDVYTNLKTYTIPTDLVDDDNNLKMLSYTNMNYPSYKAYESIYNSASRLFWAISNAVFILDYSFGNHF